MTDHYIALVTFVTTMFLFAAFMRWLLGPPPNTRKETRKEDEKAKVIVKGVEVTQEADDSRQS